MKKKVAVLTDDAYLYQKIHLILSPDYVCERIYDALDGSYDLYLFDARGGGKAPSSTLTVKMSYTGDGLKIPFAPSDLMALVEGVDKTPQLSLGDKCAYFRGETVRLSELEHALLSLLVKAGGKFVSREEILEGVWRSEKGCGIINVYVHYLREKLESCGEKVIISSRSHGYKIDERFLREGGKASPV